MSLIRVERVFREVWLGAQHANSWVFGDVSGTGVIVALLQLFREQLCPPTLVVYHSFQNHCTHDIASSFCREGSRELQWLLHISGCLKCHLHYSCSLLVLVRNETTSQVTGNSVTPLWAWLEGAQTVKCKPWTERVAEKGLSRGVSRAAWKRRINREFEAKKAHKPWIREGLNLEVQTVK